MDFINAQKKTLPAECLITAVSGAVLFGGLLLYLDIPKLNFPYAALYWTGLFLCLFFIPKKWLIHCVLPVLQGWWGMDRKESHRLFFTAGISTLVSSLAAHGFLFTNEFFSHDSLSLMLSGPRRLGGLEFFTKVGRFLIPSYEGLRGNTTNSPWVVGLLFLIFMCLSAVFLVRLLDIQSTVGIALTSSLLCTSVTLSLTGATYVYAMDEYALALLLSILAVFLLQRHCTILSIICAAASLGFYQAYFSVAFVLILFCIIRALTTNGSLFSIVRQGFWYLFILFLSFCLYFFVWNFLIFILELEKMRMSETLLGNGFSALFPLLKNALLNYAHYLTDDRGILGILYPTITGLTILLIALWAFGHLLNAVISTPNKILIMLVLSFLPIAFNLSYILFMGNSSELVSFANGLIFIFLIFCWEHPPKPASSLCHRCRVVGAALLCIICWHNIVFANQTYMKKELEKNATISLATRVISRIEAVDGYVPTKTPVIFYPPANSLGDNYHIQYKYRECFADLYTYAGLWHNYSTSTVAQFPGYITRYLNYPMTFSNFDHLTASEQRQVESMPLFPADGSVEMVGGNVVVRLG